MTETQKPLFSELPPAKQYSKGYPAAPGSGPSDKQCRDCQSFYRKDGRYSKCRHVMSTHGTDISMYSPACSLFEDHE